MVLLPMAKNIGSTGRIAQLIKPQDVTMNLKTLLLRTKSPSRNPTQPLHRCLTATDLTLLGIGATIGAGIFVLTGIAAATKAGPSIVLSYFIAAMACAFSAFSYSELASSVGGCGSAYGYAYAGLGELFAWIIGWDLLLEYGLSTSTVAVGWSSYFADMLHAMGMSLPQALRRGPLEQGIINLPAALIILIVMVFLAIGVKHSARFNAIMVAIKLLVLALFVIVAAPHFSPELWHPYLAFGWVGILNGAALIFFAYIGFDAVSTAAEETINPERNVPIGIIAALIVCTLIYMITSGMLTGIVHYSQLNVSSPLAFALLHIGYRMMAALIALGAIAGITTVILVMYYGFTRVFLAIARDRLLPAAMSEVNSRTRTPLRIIFSTGFIMSLIAGLVPITELAHLVNIGTLAAFTVVCAGVLVMRRTHPEMPRPFRVPFSPLFPSIGIALCILIMLSLPLFTWIGFGLWTAFGLVVYFSYSRFHSLLNESR